MALLVLLLLRSASHASAAALARRCGAASRASYALTTTRPHCAAPSPALLLPRAAAAAVDAHALHVAALPPRGAHGGVTASVMAAAAPRTCRRNGLRTPPWESG
jgi:hypothetical protein